MFIKLALQDSFFYFIAVFTLIGFMVLYELAHGVVAISEGDDRPQAIVAVHPHIPKPSLANDNRPVHPAAIGLLIYLPKSQWLL